jgi:hypothetical protein
VNMGFSEIVSVADARAMLPQFLARLQDAGRDAEPIFIGAGGKADGVLISVELFDELSSLRAALSAGPGLEIHPPPTA